MRIGVSFPGDPGHPATWSGTPYGVICGLEEAGVEAVPINVGLRSRVVRVASTNLIATTYIRPARDVMGAVKRARKAAGVSPRLAAVRTLAAPGALRRAGRLDGIVQIGTGYTLDSPAPIVTFEDMTIPQVRVQTLHYTGWGLLSEREFKSRIARQRRAYERAIGCCVTTPWAAESVLREYSVPEEKVHVVGIGCNHTVPPVERDWSTPRFLFVGMDWQLKNGPRVLAAFARLRESLPAARLDLVGGHPPLSEPHVTGHGVLRLDVPDQRRQIEQLYAEATCFLMPSHAEAAGIAFVEAAAAGLPSIGTTAGGSAYIVGDGGLIVDPSDDLGLYEAMRRLADPEVAAKVGAAAKRRSELFTWGAVARRVLGVLQGEDLPAIDQPVGPASPVAARVTAGSDRQPQP